MKIFLTLLQISDATRVSGIRDIVQGLTKLLIIAGAGFFSLWYLKKVKEKKQKK